MTTPAAVEPTKNPTALLQDQVTALQEIQESLTAINENQVKILESLAGLDALTRGSMEDEIDVSVRDIAMSFGSMVNFMVKWMIASLPAAIILISIVAGILLVLTIFFGGISQLF